MKHVVLLCVFIICSMASLQAKLEEGCPVMEVVEDDESHFRLICYFNSATITTEFKRIGNNKSYNLIAPCKQLFKYQNLELANSHAFQSTYLNDRMAFYFATDINYAIRNHMLTVSITYWPDTDSFSSWYVLEEVNLPSWWD